jgi:hypothetical protein
VKVTVIALPSGHWHASSGRPNDYAQWRQGQELRDQDFCRGSSREFKDGLRKRLKWMARQSNREPAQRTIAQKCR